LPSASPLCNALSVSRLRDETLPFEEPPMSLLAPHCAAKATAMASGLLLLLAACAAEPSGPAATGDRGTALPPPTAGESAAGGSLPVAPATPLPDTAGGGEGQSGSGDPVIVEGPDGTSWQAYSSRDEAVYQADIEDCYRYAAALTERDAQHIDDRNAGIDTLTNRSPYSGLRQRVDEFDLRNRRTSLMSSCMESKGYARADTTLPRLEF
jgi:hypothetical protein